MSSAGLFEEVEFEVAVNGRLIFSFADDDDAICSSLLLIFTVLFDHFKNLLTSSTGPMQCRGEHREGCGHDHHHDGEWYVDFLRHCSISIHHFLTKRYSDHDEEDPEGQSMFSAIDTTKIRCLNASVPGSGVHPFKPYDKVRDYVLYVLRSRLYLKYA